MVPSMKLTTRNSKMDGWKMIRLPFHLFSGAFAVGFMECTPPKTNMDTHNDVGDFIIDTNHPPTKDTPHNDGWRLTWYTHNDTNMDTNNGANMLDFWGAIFSTCF